MILSGIDVVGVIFGVVDVLFRAVTSKPFAGDLEFASTCDDVLIPAVYFTEMTSYHIQSS